MGQIGWFLTAAIDVPTTLFLLSASIWERGMSQSLLHQWAKQNDYASSSRKHENSFEGRSPGLPRMLRSFTMSPLKTRTETGAAASFGWAVGVSASLKTRSM